MTPVYTGGQGEEIVRRRLLLAGWFASVALRSLWAATWPAKLTVVRDSGVSIAGTTYASSSRLLVSWDAAIAVPPRSRVRESARYIDHYEVTASTGRSTVRTITAASGTVLRGLKSGTEYAVTLRACLDAPCAQWLDADTPEVARTEDEYWQIQGGGNSFATARKLVADGNVGSSAFRYGPWAGPQLDGKVPLYYVPLGAQEKGVKIGEMVALLADSLSAVSAFSGVPGYGLRRACPMPAPGQSWNCPSGTNLAASVSLFQAVPLSEAMGGAIRLFFNGDGRDGRSRVLYLDSQDGYAGRDFHRGASTVCATFQDFETGGGCEPAVAVGVDIDTPDGNPHVAQARQFQIGYPTLGSTQWNGAAGTFMWFTLDRDNACTPHSINFGYAVWDGRRWVVQYASNGCPKMLQGTQAPAMVHLGGARYKMYFNYHATPVPLDPQRNIKPVRLVYADGARSGDPAVVDFEDWETVAESRQVHYLWPDGGLVDEASESRLDDYVIFYPTGDPSLQVMYTNMSTGPGSVPFIGLAVLVNP